MQNREEDRPIVILLSLAIIGVFSYFVWQRLQSPPSAAPVTHGSTSPVRPVSAVASPLAHPGEIRYIDDKLLDAPTTDDVDMIDHGDPFHPLPTPLRNVRSSMLPGPSP